MRCDEAQRTFSEAMDAPVSAAATVQVDSHVEACPRCARFAEQAWQLRHAVRLRPAPAVPDLTPAIMPGVVAERSTWPLPARSARLRGRARALRGATLRRLIAAAAALGLVAGFVVTAGLRVGGGPSEEALAAAIPHDLVRAAVSLDGYRATFDVVERDFAHAIPVRTFVATVGFRAPEDLRVRVRDTTRYPSAAWPVNDLTLVSDGRTWRASGPQVCPAAVPPVCPVGGRVDRVVLHRAPFDPRSVLPTDIIVPMTVLAAANRVDVIRPGRVGSRDAIAVGLSLQDATPLLSYLQFLGAWRPFFPQDRVVVWLDRVTWFPLRYEVFPATGPDRTAWAARLGLPAEPASRPIFTATVRSLSTAPPPPSLFRVDPVDPNAGTSVVDEGFDDLPLSQVGALDTLPIPRDTAGLHLVRYGRYRRTPAHRYELRALAYARGLGWLTIAEVTGWPGRQLFGVGPFAERIALRSGPAYYEPASDLAPRRLSIHTARGELLISTDLPRASMLRVAASLPVTPLAEPAGWRIHRSGSNVTQYGLTLGQAAARMPFPVLEPTWLPGGYAPSTAETVTSSTSQGFTILYRGAAAQLDGQGLELYQSTGTTLSPPGSADEVGILVRGVLGRWSPRAGRLEWIEGGAYRSLSGSFDLATLIRVAASLRPWEAR